MKRVILMLAIVAAACVTFSSCANEGCTEPNAVNYDPTADKNDGSCFYNNGGGSGGGGSCTATVYFESYDNEDYTIYSN